MSETPKSWNPLETHVRFTPESISELLDGGQAFRWNRTQQETWQGHWGEHIIEIGLGPEASLQWRSLGENSGSNDTTVRHYLRLDEDENDNALARLPWRSDAHLKRCMDAFPGLRILRQPFGETLLGFLCSATKQIVQIKQMMALLAANHGSPQTQSNLLGYLPENQLPTWEQLAETSEDQLRACQLGFRARYIKGIADYIKANPGWFKETTKLPYEEAKTALCKLPGVGEKIADCVALFGLGHQQAFPVDTWMIKSMSRRYGLDGWSPSQVAHFGRIHFGDHAGLAQQYLFAWERAYGKR